MAQLPPKIPQNWPSFPYQRIPVALPNFMNPTASPPPSLAAMNGASTNQTTSSWVDEFLDFSSHRRGAHRRSVSDSIAFLDQPLTEECIPRQPPRDSNAMVQSEPNIGFDSLDDDQLMSMFSDDVYPSLPPAVSSSSDQNSNNDEKTATPPLVHQQQPKTEPGEVQSSCKPEPLPVTQPHPPPTSNPDSIIDPKRVKRILANRQSAQRSRVRKMQYISELERSVTTLQTEVSALSPRVAFLDHQRVILTVENSAMKQRIAALAQDKIFKDAHQEALKKEIERLTQLMHHQRKVKEMSGAAVDNNAPPQQPPLNSDSNICTEGQVFE